MNRPMNVGRGKFTDLTLALHRTRLLLSDFDGSIVPDHLKKYTDDQKVLEAANIARCLYPTPFKFVTMTGGSLERLMPWAEMSNAPVFAENAGVVFNPRDKSGKITILMGKEEADFIIKFVSPKIEHELERSYPGYGKSSNKITMSTYFKPENVPIEEFRDHVLSFLSRELDAKQYSRIFVTYGKTLIDVNHVGADKSRAIKFASELFRTEVDGMTAYGDGDNDRPAFDALIRGQGTVIIPANHDEEVGRWAENQKNHSRVTKHHLESTECFIDILRQFYDKLD